MFGTFFNGLNLFVDLGATVRAPGQQRKVDVQLLPEEQDELVRPEEQDEMPKANYYAVAVGRNTGIYGTWAECQAQVSGVSGAKFKKFGKQKEAQSFIEKHGCAIRNTDRQRNAPDANIDTVIRGVPLLKPNPDPIQGGRDPVNKKGRTRSSSPLAQIASLDRLPDDLAELSKKGWMFTATDPPRLVVYTDGSGLANGTKRAVAGAGVYWGEGEAEKYNLSERVPGKLQTNNRGELLSIIRALEECPFPQLTLEIRTDSQYSIQAMTLYLPNWIRNGWRTQSGPVKNADMIRHLLVLLRRRAAAVRFKHVRGHSGHAGNDCADELARKGAIMPPLADRTDWLDPDFESIDVANEEPVNVAVDIDPDWLMSAAEMAALERSLSDPDE
ncbi:hypothetical protein CcaverHIS002_0506920 [Cutaneotrichosporon cavernicola]|uniref:ribonuclease H n=1 Tax=Cutaneotrichosporon cavernicola TaxID=279322 RepID=A0AA48L705_9TREE|nr:uncharacterized protein CcaverHIS019_0507450 [Cutaneotrichosporon cavernicola]BEI85291.1 hypothetical protein CcaverHIS002_0506920 [Cutaneotrichosporon cavernicola]BEI93117.1 hypothetical protein CcaverHIS019_0507450 [Cutaneotrichosporon cavernicola]BEJ00894.1 hypothetical protein CcaverHIS631_0507510 [Cutaneotrichosporon cavernicola]BEJ08660.1 hypothetical protein CcaverHIS641_0507540 [Cutaneotrichosporon cavernicola]